MTHNSELTTWTVTRTDDHVANSRNVKRNIQLVYRRICVNCFYCRTKIEKTSKEHVIHNALGGHLESIDICCPDCNNKIQRLIDDDFTKIFAPIIGRVSNLKKTSNTKSKPSYNGFAKYGSKKYDVTLKDGKIIDCIDLKKELRRNLTKDDFEKFEIIGYKFDLDNQKFRNGMVKIACNFAISNGVSKKLLSKRMDISLNDNKLEHIDFKHTMIPFVALNHFDNYFETVSSLELYHNIVLFNIENTLWCYVDLFNTFQFYVQLTNEWKEEDIYKSYAQNIEKIERQIPNIQVRKAKDVHMYAHMYEVEPTMDIEILKKRINDKINKASYERDIGDIVKCKFTLNNDFIKNSISHEDLLAYYRSVVFYLDDNDSLIDNRFRRFTPSLDITVQTYESYPNLIYELIESDIKSVRVYTEAKFHRLNEFLCFG